MAIDLYCGLGGWTEGFLSEGYQVIGFDIERRTYPGEMVIQDVLTLHGSQFKDAAIIVGSSPCQEFSYRALPFKRGKMLGPPELGIKLFQTQFRIQREASEAAGHHIPMVVENVRGAQPWVGRAAWHYGSFFLWGDVPPIMPTSIFRPSKSALKRSGIKAYEWLRTTIAAFGDDPGLPWDAFPCVEWPYSLKGSGHATGDGYGQVYLDGKLRSAHREAWILSNGEIPDGLNVLHRCDVRPCIRPSHLFLGNTADNLADCSEKGRMHLGEENGQSKLTAVQVIEIKRRLASGDVQRRIAEDFGISYNAISKISMGTKWGHVQVDDGIKIPNNSSARRFDERPIVRLNAVNKHEDGYTVAVEDMAAHFQTHAEKEKFTDGVKQHGSGAEWFDTGIAKHGSHTAARKAATAQISKIPFELARHIASVYKP